MATATISAQIPGYALSMAGKHHVQIQQKGYETKSYSLAELVQAGIAETDPGRRAVLLRAYEYLRKRTG